MAVYHDEVEIEDFEYDEVWRLCHDWMFREGIQKNKRFFWEISPKSVFPPTHPRVFVRFGRTEGEIWVEKAIFGAILGGFQGFGPCLGFSHPTHPHLGEISQKKFFLLLPF